MSAARRSRCIIDGYNLLPFLSGKEPCPRDGFIYWSDDGDLMALRVQQYKIVFAEQLATGLEVWREPLKQMRIPKMFDLRSDPFEAGEDSIKYNDWFVEHVPFQYAAQAVVHQWLESFKEFPPRQKAASFTVDQIVEKLMPGVSRRRCSGGRRRVTAGRARSRAPGRGVEAAISNGAMRSFRLETSGPPDAHDGHE